MELDWLLETNYSRKSFWFYYYFNINIFLLLFAKLSEHNWKQALKIPKQVSRVVIFCQLLGGDVTLLFLFLLLVQNKTELLAGVDRVQDRVQ